MRHLVLVLTLLLGSIGITSCDHIKGDKEYELDPRAIKPGPGLFTGRSGHWTILRK
jgi:hypothetical protein